MLECGLSIVVAALLGWCCGGDEALASVHKCHYVGVDLIVAGQLDSVSPRCCCCFELENEAMK